MRAQIAEVESRAHLEAAEHFAEQLKQFPVSRDHVTRLERDIAKLAVAAMTASQRPPQGEAVQTDEGWLWHKSVELYENVCICHRQGAKGIEFAIVERFPSGSNEIWVKGRNAVEVLKAFSQDQQHALQIWREDIQAQMKQFLADRYPGEDRNRIAENFVRRFTGTQCFNPPQDLI